MNVCGIALILQSKQFFEAQRSEADRPEIHVDLEKRCFLQQWHESGKCGNAAYVDPAYLMHAKHFWSGGLVSFRGNGREKTEKIIQIGICHT